MTAGGPDDGAWTSIEMAAIDRADEIEVSVRRRVDFVEAGEHVGDGAGLDNALDQAYRTKYGRWAGPVQRITAEPARETTLRLDPA